MKRLIISTMVQEFVDPEAKKDDNKSNGNRGYQSNNQSQGSNQSSGGNNDFDSFEDDFLP